MRISFAYLRYICYISLIALIYIYICIHTYIIVRTCVCIYVEMYMHLQIHIHICTHVRMSSSCVSPIHSTVAINCTYTYTYSLFFFIFLPLLMLLIHSINTHSYNSFHSFLFFPSNIYLSKTVTSVIIMRLCCCISTFVLSHYTEFSKPIVTVSYSHTSEFAGL